MYYEMKKTSELTTIISESEIDDKPIFRKLLELYAHDFSEYVNKDVNNHGEYGYRRLDHYWVEEDRYPFLFRTDGKISGFAMVRKDENNFYSIAEFFVMRKYRNRGIGKEAAFFLFRKFAGNWNVGVLDINTPALIFWEKVIAEFARGSFKIIEKKDWKGPVYEFSCPK